MFIPPDRTHTRRLTIAGFSLLVVALLPSCGVLRVDELREKNTALERYSMILEVEAQEQSAPTTDTATAEPRELTWDERMAAAKIKRIRAKEAKAQAKAAAKQEKIVDVATVVADKPEAKPKAVRKKARTKPDPKKVADTPQKQPEPPTPPIDVADHQDDEPMILPAGEDAEVMVEIPGLTPVDKGTQDYSKDPVDEAGLYPEE